MTEKTAMQIQRYTRTAMAFHWLIALLILANVAMIWIVGYLPDGMVRPVIDTHKSLGITVLGLAILRVLWRATHPVPPLPPSYSAWERLSAHAAHWVLYALVFCLPLSGWAQSTPPTRTIGMICSSVCTPPSHTCFMRWSWCMWSAR
jgi:cytochrome b561